MIKKFIGSFIIFLLLTPVAHALSYSPCSTDYVRVSKETMFTLIQMIKDEFDKSPNRCNYVVYDKRTSTLIVSTNGGDRQSILEFIQKTDRELNMGNHSKNTDNEMLTNPDDKIDDENIDSP